MKVDDKERSSTAIVEAFAQEIVNAVPRVVFVAATSDPSKDFPEIFYRDHLPFPLFNQIPSSDGVDFGDDLGQRCSRNRIEPKKVK